MSRADFFRHASHASYLPKDAQIKIVKCFYKPQKHRNSANFSIKLKSFSVFCPLSLERMRGQLKFYNLSCPLFSYSYFISK